MPGTSGWFHTPAARPDARLRLYCIPYAGGGPGVYREWPAGLGDEVEVRAVVLPGRERRFLKIKQHWDPDSFFHFQQGIGSTFAPNNYIKPDDRELDKKKAYVELSALSIS